MAVRGELTGVIGKRFVHDGGVGLCHVVNDALFERFGPVRSARWRRADKVDDDDREVERQRNHQQGLQPEPVAHPKSPVRNPWG